MILSKNQLESVRDAFRYQSFSDGDLKSKHLAYLNSAIAECGINMSVLKEEKVIHVGDRLGMLRLCDDLTQEVDANQLDVVATHVVFPNNPITRGNGHAIAVIAVSACKTIFVIDPEGSVGWVSVGSWTSNIVRKPWKVQVKNPGILQEQLSKALVSNDMHPGLASICQWLSTLAIHTFITRTTNDVMEMLTDVLNYCMDFDQGLVR